MFTCVIFWRILLQNGGISLGVDKLALIPGKSEEALQIQILGSSPEKTASWKGGFCWMLKVLCLMRK